ncbi:MAG: hypothetical protein AAFY29_16575 [Pseudomonadota bacterium]
MKRKVITALLIYMLPGLFLGAHSWISNLQSFDCVAPGQPHGYIGVFTNSFENPDPQRCARRGLGWESAVTLPFFLAFGTPLLVAKALAKRGA